MVSLEDCFAILEDTTFKKLTKTRDAGAWGDPGPDAQAVFWRISAWQFLRASPMGTREYPELVKYLTAFIARHSGVKDLFTSVVVARNLETGLHRGPLQCEWDEEISLSLAEPTSRADYGSREFTRTQHLNH